jgi:hypothetical protein
MLEAESRPGFPPLRTLNDLMTMPEADLIAWHDHFVRQGRPTYIGPDRIIDEIVRRETRRQTERLIVLTVVIAVLTAVIAGLTIWIAKLAVQE